MDLDWRLALGAIGGVLAVVGFVLLGLSMSRGAMRWLRDLRDDVYAAVRLVVRAAGLEPYIVRLLDGLTERLERR